MTHDLLPRDLKRTFRQRLLRWYRKHGRDLPWRRTRDPYKVLVSEVMLQQTQVDRVLDFYPQFLRRYPTLETLARSSPSGVREAWEGLGYYARARNLREAARKIVHEHSGAFPRSYEEIRRLPGVGPYTAGAVLSFAFENPAPALDTNVKRVLQRVFIRRPPPRQGELFKRLHGLSLELIPPRRAWAFNQALMDFGAMICTARKPRCSSCCMQDICIAFPRLSRGADTLAGSASPDK